MHKGELKSRPGRLLLGELAKRCHHFPKGETANVIQGVNCRLLINKIIKIVMS